MEGHISNGSSKNKAGYQTYIEDLVQRFKTIKGLSENCLLLGYQVHNMSDHIEKEIGNYIQTEPIQTVDVKAVHR